MRGPIDVKFCTMVSTRPNFIMPVQNFFGGRTPKKFQGPKTCKICHSVYRVSSCVRRNKSGEVWSSDLGDLDVKSYPPKAHFSEDDTSAPRGCCAPKFLHALENDQVLLAHPPPGTGAPLTIFFKGGSKIGLKCNKGARACSPTKLWHLTRL